MSKAANDLLHERVQRALEDVKGVEIRVLDVREMTTITDYMVVATGTSDRHVRALADNVIETAAKLGFKPLGVEGENEAHWILLDLQDVVVHVMQKSAREFYQLERLWSSDTAETEERTGRGGSK